MIELRTKTSVESICGALRNHGATVVDAGLDRARFKCAVDGYEAEVRVEDEWCLVEGHVVTSAASKTSGKLLHDALTWNTQLTGAARFAINDQSSLCVLAEIPLGPGADVNAVAHQILTPLREAVMVSKNGDAPAWAPNTAAAPNQDSADELDLVALCDEAGWPASKRSSGLVMVELEVPNSHYHASLCIDRSGLHCSVEFALPEALQPACRQATALLALSVGGLVRFVRAEVHQSGSEAALRHVVRGPVAPAPQEIINALGCLSVACQLSGEEFKALHHEAAAREYLAIRGWSVFEVDNQPQERTAS